MHIRYVVTLKIYKSLNIDTYMRVPEGQI